MAAQDDFILAAEDVHKRFGGVHALQGAGMRVRAGEIHSLVGENGSGKSTLLKILSGQIRRDAGRVVFAGEEVEFRNPIEALRRGIATVTQETTLVPELTVAENIFLGRRMVRRRLAIDWRATRRRAREALDRLDLELDPERVVRRLRPDQQQMVEIARALSVNARVFILDEPTSSLTDDEVDSLFRVVRRLKEENVATIFVSHRLGEIFELSDRVTVLRDGVTVGGGRIGELDRRKLISLMVGRAFEEYVAEHAALDVDEPLLRVRHLSLPGALADVSLDVAPGEIVGLAGLVGAGRSELLEALFGLHPEARGEVILAGRNVRHRSAREAAANGLAFVPADRKRQGLILSMSVRENLTMAATAHTLRIVPPSAARESAIVNKAISTLRIMTASSRALVSTLSGGNQQKVVLGKWLATQPRVLMLDEPTRGVDVGAKAEIYRLLGETAQRGLGMLVSSSEIPELLILCDRILVMFRGRVTASFNRDEATEARIAHFAAGHQ